MKPKILVFRKEMVVPTRLCKQIFDRIAAKRK